MIIDVGDPRIVEAHFSYYISIPHPAVYSPNIYPIFLSFHQECYIIVRMFLKQ
jgi:hypothetical protein